MTNQMKYIIFDDGMHEQPLVFSSLMQHDVVLHFNWEVVSAGFVDINNDGEFFAWGESVSLGVSSRPQDSQLINRMFGRGNK